MQTNYFQRLTYLTLQVNPKITSIVLITAYTLCLAATYLTLIYPGSSYITIWLPDVIGFIDIANRVSLGEVPYKDFTFVYGPLVAFIPGLALFLGKNAGTIFAIDGFIVAVVLLFSALIILPRRLTTSAALLVFLFAWLLIVIPMGNGLTFSDISWAMYYNRQGWAALILIFVLYVEPVTIGKSDKWLDAIALALLVLFELGDKLPFAMVAVAFISINAMTSRYKRQVSLRSLVIIALVVTAEEAMFGLALPYLQNILTLSRSLNGGRLGIWVFATFLIENAPIILVSLGSVMAARAVGRQSALDWLYAVGVIASVLLLLTTIGAGSERGAFAVFIVLICLGELARRAEIENAKYSLLQVIPPWKSHLVSLGCLFIAAAFIATESGNRLLAWQDFAAKVQKNGPAASTPSRLSQILLPDIDKKKGGSIGITSYMETIIDGTNLLLTLQQPERTVLNFDMVNPFPYAAAMKPPVKGYPLFYFDGARTTNPTLLPAPKEFVGNVDYVMVPKMPYSNEQLEIMMKLYGAYLKQNYFLYKESIYWDLWKRNMESQNIKSFK